MGILRVEGLAKSFGTEELFHDVSFAIGRGDKVGLVGENGAGKTTLLRCILGLEEFDGGAVHVPDGETVGYVEQESAPRGVTLWEELEKSFADVLSLQSKMKSLTQRIESGADEAEQAALLKEYAAAHEHFERAGGYEYESAIRRVAFGLGFCEKDFQRAAASFSGGQKTRFCLARALIRRPDFLLLDEPTNHLDMERIEWLEGFLRDYKGGVLLISHDRFFLDRVATHIAALEHQTVKLYEGNYTRYVKLREEQRAALESAWEKQQTYIQRTEAYIRRYKAGIKSKQARGREKKLNRMERIVLPPQSAGFHYFAFNPPAQCAERVAMLEDVAAVCGNAEVLRGVSLSLRRGDGAALIGENGAGKTTLLKILTGELEAVRGSVKIGNRIQIGYYAQQHEGLHMEKTLLNELMDEFHLTEKDARHFLGAFLFRGDDVYKLVGDLSGGEKSRLAFLKLLLARPNFLLLDEPTNHLDIKAKEVVEEALMTFPGTFLVVSHDRYFLDKVTNRTFELKDGALTEYGGNYSYYRQKKEELSKEKAEKAQAKNAAQRRPAEKKRQTAKGKTLKAAERERLAQRYEGEIVMLEMEQKGLEHRLNDPEIHRDAERSRSLAAEYERLAREIEEKYRLWEECTTE